MRHTQRLVSLLCAVGLCGGLVAITTAARADIVRPPVTALPPAASPVPGTYRSVSPARLLDTRQSSTHPKQGSVVHVAVTGRSAVPTSGVAAVFLHVTAANVLASGYATVYPSGTTLPATSALNFTRGLVLSNNVLVAPGGNGSVAVRLGMGATDIVVDVLGWVVGGAVVPAGGVVPVTPTRLLDTRTPGHTPLTSAGLTLNVGAGVPSGAAAAVLNVTVVDSTRSLPITVWPAGKPRPLASSLNSALGRPVAASVVVGLGGGAVSFAVYGTGSTQLIVDLLGYVAGGTAMPGGMVAITPTRVLDTRVNHQPLPSGGTRSVVVRGHGAPADAHHALVTVTSVPSSTAGGYLVAYADGEATPAVSDLNPLRDVPIASQFLVPLGPDGGFTLLYKFGSGDIIVDLNGYVRARTLPPVVPTVLSQADRTPLVGDQPSRSASVLTTTNRYALQTWWPTVAPGLLTSPLDKNAQADSTDAVRRLSMEAFSLATSLASGAYDPIQTGASTQTATNVVTQIVNTVACRHRANRVSGWGGSWQSAMWASLAGRAGWLLWSNLSSATATCVQQMMISEADYVATLIPKYLIDANGKVLTPGDTGAEEDSWYALAPGLAIAMMPTAEQRDTWRRREEQMLVAAWARPSDVTSSQSVDGTSLTAWLDGSNVAQNGVVTNHSRIAPDYSTTAYQSVDTLKMAVLAGQPVPQASLFGLGPVYHALGAVSYTAPPYASPGGTVYSPNTATIYYPQGCDWGTGQETPYALFDADTDVFGLDNAAVMSAATEASLHLAAAAAMQRRSSTGAMYQSSTEYNYAGREEHTAQLAAQTYLAYFTQARLNVEVTPQPVAPNGPGVAPATTRAPVPANETILMH